MTTFFDTAKRSFKNVTVDENNGINTTEFLEAAESVVTLFDLLGSAAFKPVQSDMTGNITKIRNAQNEIGGDTTNTLQKLTTAEQKAGKKTATEGLLWLNRGLEFTAQALRNNHSNSTEELSTSFTSAYKGTLQKHHNFVVKGIFSVAMKACPYRKTFYEKLGNDQALVQTELAEWLNALEKNVRILNDHYQNIKI
ncbi:glycolipid transfer protein domain-containing protein [Kalaharituber pfeilii]|nr:glycolipid transfer protein domain-containing protein [Kalaharituber pfeilii]